MHTTTCTMAGQTSMMTCSATSPDRWSTTKLQSSSAPPDHRRHTGRPVVATAIEVRSLPGPGWDTPDLDLEGQIRPFPILNHHRRLASRARTRGEIVELAQAQPSQPPPVREGPPPLGPSEPGSHRRRAGSGPWEVRSVRPPRHLPRRWWTSAPDVEEEEPSPGLTPPGKSQTWRGGEGGRRKEERGRKGEGGGRGGQPRCRRPPPQALALSAAVRRGGVGVGCRPFRLSGCQRGDTGVRDVSKIAK